MTPDEILKYCLENLEGTVLVNSWGDCPKTRMFNLIK